jgi:hypothetical protein
VNFATTGTPNAEALLLSVSVRELDLFFDWIYRRSLEVQVELGGGGGVEYDEKGL